MKTVFLIGNGFDKKHGLKTGYDDFRNYYKGLDALNQDKDILAFISRVETEELADDRWSDLEIALGLHTDVFKGENMVDDAIDFHDKLSFAIFEYLKIQGSELKMSEGMQTQFHKYLAVPEGDRRLTPDEIGALFRFNEQWKNTSPWDVKIITFNYTNSIERFCKFSAKEINVGTRRNRPVILSNIEHIHGYHDNRQIIGVNDESQIVNKSLHGTDAMDWYVKPKNNLTNGEGCQQKCLNWINQANVICVFGLSYGQTDLIWWQSVIDRMLKDSNTRLLLFVYDDKNKFNNNQSAHKNRFKQREKERFIKASGKQLTDSQITTLKGRIFVGYNTNLFESVL